MLTWQIKAKVAYDKFLAARKHVNETTIAEISIKRIYA